MAGNLLRAMTMIARTVLVIDDDEEVLMVLQRFFKRHGFKVLMAENGAEGIQMALSREVHLLIQDILLAEQDGFETLAEFRKHFPTLPIIILTGMPLDTEFETDLISAGATVCLKKTEPFTTLLRVATELTNSDAAATGECGLLSSCSR